MERAATVLSSGLLDHTHCAAVCQEFSVTLQTKGF